MNRALHTPRLTLEVLRPDHAERLYDGARDPRLYTFLPADPPRSVAALRDRLEPWAAQRSPDGTEIWLNWAARDRELCRYVGTFQATVRRGRRAVLAYLVFPACWRRGYAREGCEAVLAHLRGAHQIETVRAEIDTENTASIRLIESLGFRRVGTRRDADFFKGRSSHEHDYELALGAPRQV